MIIRSITFFLFAACLFLSPVSHALDVGFHDSPYLIKTELGQGTDIRFHLCLVEKYGDEKQCVVLSSCFYSAETLEPLVRKFVKEGHVQDAFMILLSGSVVKQYARAEFLGPMLEILEAGAGDRDCRISFPISFRKILTPVWQDPIFARPKS
jgi:hypothetical protein